MFVSNESTDSDELLEQIPRTATRIQYDVVAANGVASKTGVVPDKNTLARIVEEFLGSYGRAKVYLSWQPGDIAA